MGNGASTGNGAAGVEAGEPRRAGLVTGASSGIGLAIAAMLASEGHDLTLTSRTAAKLDAAAASVAALGTEVREIQADVGDPDLLPQGADPDRG